MINELNEAHRSNRQLQVRIDELREEMSLYMPNSPSGKKTTLDERNILNFSCYGKEKLRQRKKEQSMHARNADDSLIS